MMKSFQTNSYLFGGNAPYVEELYESYLNNPGSVPERWREYFDNLQHVPAADGNPQTRDVAHAPIVQSFAERAKDGTLQPRVMGGDAANNTDLVKIAGKDYTITSYDDEAYVQRVATYVDRRMEELSAAAKLPSAQLAVLTAMNVTDDMLKAPDEIRRLRAELSEVRAENEALKKEAGR